MIYGMLLWDGPVPELPGITREEGPARHQFLKVGYLFTRALSGSKKAENPTREDFGLPDPNHGWVLPDPKPELLPAGTRRV